MEEDEGSLVVEAGGLVVAVSWEGEDLAARLCLVHAVESGATATRCALL